MLKLPRITLLTPVTAKGDVTGSSTPFSRMWDTVAGHVENSADMLSTQFPGAAVTNAGAALRDGDNELTGANNFDQAPNSDSGYNVSGVKIIGQQDTGWTAGTGTAHKTGFAAYGGQNVNSSYNETQVQNIDDAAKAASQRLLAIENALRAHGLID